jgi:PAS domain S-box-containing protein
MQQVRVLLVEDESIVAEDIQERLTHMGSEVVGIASSGEQAAEYADKLRPDLVLMDIRLQGRVDGIEAAAMIRRKLSIPVIFLTAHSDDVTLERAKRTEPNGFLLKPFEERDLRVNIEMALYKHEMERRLRDSEQRYATTLSSIGDGVIATDEKGHVTFMNAVAEELTGWSARDALGVHLSEVFSIVNEDTRAAVENPVARALREKTTVDLANHTVLLGRHGKEVPIEDCASPIRDDHREIRGGVLVFRDVSQKRHTAEMQRKSEEQLQWLQRLNAIGRCAGGVAHEINNMLTVVLGCGEFLLSQLNADHPLRPTLDAMLTAGDRTAAMTRQLLAFSRKQVLTPVRLNLNSIIEKMQPLLTRLMGTEIDVVLWLDPTLDTVTVDRLQWEQVVINLALNARDAMPDGGALVFESHNVRLGEDFVRSHPEVEPGRYVHLSVRDTGIGMDAETLKQIFEPFFTTKEFGKGAGLGLATVYGVVKQSGGHVFVDSTPGQGSTFNFYLPAEAGHLSNHDVAATASPMPGGSETILLVEDEDTVRTWIRHVLQAMGYTVVETANGAEALRLFETSAAKIDLVLTDVMMPRMHGAELAGRLLAKRPEVKVLYMSGCVHDSNFPDELRNKEVDFLQKPFTASTLAAKVRSLLEARAS